MLPSLLYGCETWTCYRRHIKKLDQFHLRCLRSILQVNWKDHVPNQEILRRAGICGIEAMLNQAQIRWTGYVIRMEDTRLPKQLFHAELATGKRNKGGQRKRYKDVPLAYHWIRGKPWLWIGPVSYTHLTLPTIRLV